MGVRSSLRIVTILCLAGISLASWSSAASASECSNEARRKEQNATYLPDCRAYEMISPVEKKGSDIVGDTNTAQLSVSGDSATFESLAGFGEAGGTGLGGFSQYVTKRGEGGWGTPVGIYPQPVKDDLQFVVGATTVPVLSSSLDEALFEGYQMVGSLNPDIPHGDNTYVENTETRALEAVTSPSGVNPSSIFPLAFEFSFRGASADLRTVAFENFENLLPELPPTQKLYAWSHGKVEVAGVLPNGSLPAGGSGAVQTEPDFSYPMLDQVSRDGSRVLFRSPTDGSKRAQIYMRRNGTSTAWVSQSESSTPVAEPQVEYLDMSADNQVLFASYQSLTDSDPGGAGKGLYLYTDSPNPESEQNLTFVARVSYNGVYTAMSDDAKRIYFFSETMPGMPQTGTYLWDEGTMHFVAATVTPLGNREQPDNHETIAATSADGGRLAFIAPRQLTEAPVGPSGQGEREGATGDKLPAMYVYDEASGLRCVSCLPTGAPTTSPVRMMPEAAELLPRKILYTRSRFISSDGRFAFFSTADALVPGDVNGVEDVYEYDMQTSAVSLLSAGTDGAGSWFADASSDGSNVMFVSRTPYLRQDIDNLIDVYDVRVDGGFPQPPPPTGPCVGDECQGVPSAAPSFNTASGFTGLGNVVHPSSGKAKPRGLTRAQKLRRALKACRRRHGKDRHRCEARARKRYGAIKASKSTSTSRAARR